MQWGLLVHNQLICQCELSESDQKPLQITHKVTCSHFLLLNLMNFWWPNYNKQKCSDTFALRAIWVQAMEEWVGRQLYLAPYKTTGPSVSLPWIGSYSFSLMIIQCFKLTLDSHLKSPGKTYAFFKYILKVVTVLHYCGELNTLNRTCFPLWQILLVLTDDYWWGVFDFFEDALCYPLLLNCRYRHWLFSLFVLKE